MLVSGISSPLDALPASSGSGLGGTGTIGDDTYKEGSPRTRAKPELETDPLSMDMTSRKVLIVEDAIELAEVIAATLERINIQTFHESHVERALEVYDAEHPDLILLDIGLPDKTGWKLLDEIKAEADDFQPIVVVMTAHDDPANRLMGKLQGVNYYLIKPFTPDEVEEIVQKALLGALARVDVQDPDNMAGTDSLAGGQ